jgi:hypothetical protein
MSDGSISPASASSGDARGERASGTPAPSPIGAARSPAPGPCQITPDSRNRGEPAAGRPARRVRRAAWGNGLEAIPAPRPSPTQPLRERSVTPLTQRCWSYLPWTSGAAFRRIHAQSRDNRPEHRWQSRIHAAGDREAFRIYPATRPNLASQVQATSGDDPVTLPVHALREKPHNQRKRRIKPGGPSATHISKGMPSRLENCP